MEQIIEKQIDERTKDDAVMNKFLKKIIENDTNTSQFRKIYEQSIEEAVMEVSGNEI